MGLFDKLKLDGTKMVGNYKAASASGSLDIRGSAIEYKTGDLSIGNTIELRRVLINYL